MKKYLILLATPLLALTACESETPDPTPPVIQEPDQNQNQDDIDECPRSDGQPCL